MKHCQIRKASLSDIPILFQYLQNPAIRVFSRMKPDSMNELASSIESLNQEKEAIGRVIVDENDYPIGFICLWDCDEMKGEGYLATWIGEEHWGQGYNEEAKKLFLQEIFSLRSIQRVFILIRTYNARSLRAIRKLPYVSTFSMEEEYYLRLKNPKISVDHCILQITQQSFERRTKIIEETL